MTNLTLRQLRYFEALARHGHFGRAAEACSISQPALSVQVKELEETLGVDLLERGARQVRLSRFGEDFVLRVRDILRAVDELGDVARASRHQLAGRLRIGIIPTVAPYLLPRMISHLTRENSALDIHVRETVTPKLLDELAEGRLDTAIVALPVSEPSLSEVPLVEESFLLVRSAQDAQKPRPAREQLQEMRLLLLEEGHCFREQALSFCQIGSGTQKLREILDGSSLSTLVQMVGAGIGITLIPEMAVPVETRSASVSVTRFDDPQPTRTIGMVWRRTSPIARQLVQIADVVREAALEVKRAGAAQSGGA